MQFTVAAFKGEGLSFRIWDHQLRQPMLITGARSLVSMSPQEGFLHPKFLTDTLGYDEPETKCKFHNRQKGSGERSSIPVPQRGSRSKPRSRLPSVSSTPRSRISMRRARSTSSKQESAAPAQASPPCPHHVHGRDRPAHLRVAAIAAGRGRRCRAHVPTGSRAWSGRSSSAVRCGWLPPRRQPVVIVGEPADEIAEAWQDFYSLAIVWLALDALILVVLYVVLGRVLDPLAKSLPRHAPARGRPLRDAAADAEGQGACRHHQPLQHARRRARRRARGE